LAQAAAMPAPLGQVHLHQLGGAMARIGPEAAAFGNRDAAFLLNVIGMWPDPSENDANIAVVRALADAMEPHSTGRAYVNFMGDEGDARVRAGYEPEAFARLQALKGEYDPTNLFRLNQNIPPAQ